MIFCPDGIIPDSGLTRLNIYLYIYMGGIGFSVELFIELQKAILII